MSLTLGEAFGEGFGWKHDVSDSCEIASKRAEPREGVEDEFTAQGAAGAAFCEMGSFLRSHIGIGV